MWYQTPGESMKLSLILAQARTGELAGLSAVDKTDEKIVGYINLGLIALYNRFQLSTEEAIITLRPDIPKNIYTMNSTDPDVKVNNAAMADDEFMSIIAAYDSAGEEIPINDDNNPYSVFTVSYNQVQVPLLVDDGHISIIYRKNPKLVTYVDNGSGAATEADVPLPVQFLEPLLHYIGYRAHGAVDGNVQAENSTHYTRYMAACNALEVAGVLTADDTISAPVWAKGFV